MTDDRNWITHLDGRDRLAFWSEITNAVLTGSATDDVTGLETALHAWRETAEILADPEAMAAIAEAQAEIERGDVICGTDAVGALCPRPEAGHAVP